MPTGKTLLKSSALRLGLTTIALLCVVGAVLSVRYFAQAAPTLTTDKPDYSSGDTVTFTGSGFAPNTSFDVPVIRPDGSIIKGDGTFTPGWDSVLSNPSGGFTYLYRLDGIPGTYQARVYPHPWNGNLSQSPLASTTFRDGNVKVFAAPDGVTFTLTATQFSTTDCSGAGSSSPPFGTFSEVDQKTFGVGNVESAMLQAAATSDQGGSFVSWTSSDPFTDLGGGAICVPGFTSGGSHDYDANYGGTPTPVPPTATNTATPTITPTPTSMNTPIPPSPTSTNTTVPPSPTSTNTTIPPSPTPTNTTIPPSPTPTNTLVPPSPTPTNTLVPPSPTPTNTPIPPSPTSTLTPVPPSPTRTNTPVPPTATLTPSPTRTATATPANTSTPTRTPSPHPTVSSVGGKVLLPPAALADASGGPWGPSGRRVSIWATLAGIIALTATVGGIYARSRRRS